MKQVSVRLEFPGKTCFCEGNTALIVIEASLSDKKDDRFA